MFQIRKNHMAMKTLFLSALAFAVLSMQLARSQGRFEVFPTKSEKDIPYRIPAIAALPDGTVICVADYRHSRNDIGIREDGRVDLHVRTSPDNGCSWGEIKTLIPGKGAESEDFMNVGGDHKPKLPEGIAPHGRPPMGHGEPPHGMPPMPKEEHNKD